MAGVNVKVISHIDEVVKEVGGRCTIALDAVGQTAEADVKILVPVGTPESTGIKGYVGGRLRSSISHEVRDKEVVIGTNVEYAKYVEYRDELNHRTGQAHYLRDGLQNNISKYESIIRDILTRM